MRTAPVLALTLASSLLISTLGADSTAGAEVAAIQWKSTGTTETALRFEPAAVNRSADGHIIVRLASIPSEEARAALAAEGIQLQRYLGANAFFAKISAGDHAAQSRAAGIVGMIEIQPAWKVHPLLAAADLPDHARFQAPARDDRIVVDGDADSEVDALAVYVQFHSDMDLATTAPAVVEAHGGVVQSLVDSINTAVAWVPVYALAGLAGEDAVQWIEPPLPALDETNNSNRVVTQVDEVQGAPYGLDGAGVSVMVYDAGYAYSSHPDFGGRLHVRGASELSDHATHVSGTIGGSGTSSGGTYRGMAPAVTIESYEFEVAGGLRPGFLYTDPGDLEEDYTEAINVYGALVANNSIGTNTAPNGFPCEWEGDYGATSMLIDAIVGGSLGAPMRIVWANGNERGSGRCGSAYHTTAPPACAKNHITVGALNSDNDSMTSFSSWGPTDDGRIKPDVSAPGCQASGDYGVTSARSNGGYSVKCGTSMASPTVCGISALVLQDYQQQYPGRPLLLNAALKMMLAHTAADRGNPGPDYQYGYGSVRAADAIDFLREGSFREESVVQGEQRLYYVEVPAGAAALKATLVWDDLPGTANTIPELVNDLDITVTSPAGITYWPWTLDPANPSQNAVRTGPDHANNIEQVVVDNPGPGLWTVRVMGHAVPGGTQTFAIGTSPSMRVCTSTGSVALDRVQYGCAAEAVVQVVDCDLNVNSTGLDSVTVKVASSSAPAGVLVELVERTPDSGVFAGTIGLSSTPTADHLPVADGDVVTATYDDEDDGGGQPATVQANALVDCVPPAISNVAWTVHGLSATVTFQTDEPACGYVRWGQDCAALTQLATGICNTTTHQLSINAAQPSTAYAFAVEAVDTQGNASSDDNGGACYGFETAAVLFFDDFPSATLNSANWPTKVGNPTVDDVGIGEPSPPYSLRLNGSPSGSEAVTTPVINLSGACGVQLSYAYEKTGGGQAPWAGDDLIVEYLDAASKWIRLGQHAGTTFDMVSYRFRNLLLPADALHAGFRLRFRSIAQFGDYDDWFVDDVQLVVPVFTDCNGNLISDTCDIVRGSSMDCQIDAIPDECQLAEQDCDGDGALDGCEFLHRVQAGDGAAGDAFGAQVDVDGDVAVIAARLTDAGGTDSGSAYIFRRVDGDWIQAQRISPNDPGSGDQFAVRVAIDGRRVVLGSYREDSAGTDAGAAYVFEDNGEQWVQTAKLVPPGTSSGDQVGLAVAIQGDLIAVSGWLDDVPATDAGCVYMYRYESGEWKYKSRVAANDAGANDLFGTDVAIDGDVLIVGAQRDDVPAVDAGSAYIFRYNGSTWVQEAKLNAPSPAAYDWYGARVDVSGDRAVVSSFYEDDGAVDTGSAYVYRRESGGWRLEAKLTSPDLSAGDQFGADAAIHGDMVIIGAAQADGIAVDSGAVYVYRRIDGAWPLAAKYAAVDGGGAAIFGNCLETDGETLIIGAPEATDALVNTGAAYLLEFAFDCNLNGVYDLCEDSSDCNGNGVADFCDLAAGSSHDCQYDGIPDECQLTTMDCNQNGAIDECDVIAGSSSDCNSDLTPDECDIAGGTSTDCSSNGVPDECEPDCDGNQIADICESQADCNANGVIDLCDVAVGTSPDCDGDRVPDECEFDCNHNGVIDDCDTPGDLTGDGYRDVLDWLAFSDCLSPCCPGDTCAPALYADACCRMADMDRDGDVDLRDYSRLSGLLDRFCASDSQCDDGLFCNGAEICAEGYCLPGQPPCDDPLAICDEEQDACIATVLYLDDFSEYPCNSDPAGWFDTGKDNSLIQDEAQFRIGCLQDNRALWATTMQVNTHSHYAPPGSEAWAVRSFSGRMLTTTLTAGIGVTFLSDYPNSDAYYRLRRGPFPGGAAFQIDPHGTTITGGVVNSGVSPAPNVWYRFRIELTDTGTETQIRAKVWAANGTEPASWQIDCYDASPTRRTVGRIGVWSMYAAGSYWDDLEVK